MGMIEAAGRPAIFELVTIAAAARGDAREELRVEIPDDKPDSQIRFAPGLSDEIFGAPDDSELQVDARTIVAALGNAIRQPSDAAYESLYRKLTEISAISVVDEVLERIPVELLDARLRCRHRHRCAFASLRQIRKCQGFRHFPAKWMPACVAKMRPGK